MASLTGSTIASSYEQLLSLPDGGLNGNTLVAITDGDSSTAIGMKVATNKIEIIPGSDDANAFEVSNAAGTAILTINSSTTSASLVQTVTTATSTPKALFIDTNTSGVAAQDSVGLHVDFDRTVAGSGTAAHNDIGIDLDVNSASLGTSSLVGMDIDVVGATSGTSTATGLAVTVGSADTNYALVTSGGNVGIGTTSPASELHVYDADDHAKITVEGAGTNSDAQITLIGTGTGKGYLAFGASSLSTDLYFYNYKSGTGTAMVIDGATNNVGIGTTAPSALLHSSNTTNYDPATSGDMVGHFICGKTDDYGIAMGSNAGGDTYSWLQSGALDSAGVVYPFCINPEGGNVGIGTATPDAHLKVEDSTLSLADGEQYHGIYSYNDVTQGDATTSSHITGIHGLVYFRDTGEVFGNMKGLRSYAYSINTAAAQSTAIFGFDNHAVMDNNTDVGNLYGIRSETNFDGGTVDSNLYGQLTFCDIESGGTISGYVLGTQIVIDSDTNPGGQVHALNLNLDTNGDYFIVAYDDVENSDRFTVSMNGTVTSEGAGNHSTGMDYAEYFESKDGSVIPIGTTVKLDDGKIVSCEEGDTPIGVVRPVNSSATIGGGQVFHWKDQFERDDYGEKIYEDYTLTKWIVEVDQAEYVERKGLDTGYKDMQNLYSQVEGSKAIPAKDAVIQQKTVDEEVEEEVTTTELVDGKYVQKTETVTKTVKVPQYDEEDLYDEDGEVIGKHQVPIMETVEEAVAAVDAVAATYFREHKYHSDRIPDGLTVPDDAEIITPAKQRQKLNPDYDPDREYESREERDEWHIVGLLGQIPTTKGQPVADNWIKMKDVSDTVEMYFVK